LVVVFALIIGCQKTEEPKTDAAIAEKPIAEIVDVDALDYVCIPFKGDYANHEKVIGELMQAIGEQQITPQGPMIGIYYNNPQKIPAEELLWEIGFPVAEELHAAEPLVRKKCGFTKVAKALYKGPFEQVDQMYPKIFECIGKQKMNPAGPIMERFLSDPQAVEPENLETEIWVSVSELPE